MATFSVNQNRQFYVANVYKSKSSLSAEDTAGTIVVKDNGERDEIYFAYKGAESLMRSDLIKVENIISATATDANDMKHNLKSVSVTLDETINSGNPVVGQDYMLRIAFRQAFGNSDNNQYFKYGIVRAYPGKTASDFYKELAESLAKNFVREITPLIDVSLVSHSTESEVADTTVPVLKNGAIQKLTDLAETSTYTSIVISEVAQPWKLGTLKQVPVYFEVYPTTITFEGTEVMWGKAEEITPVGAIDNGKKIADLEYFCMGERGDQYRKMGWPNNIDTKYLIDPEKKYNTIDIHYAYVGDGVSVQKSEKTITIAVPKIGATDKESNVLTNNIINAINRATGLMIATLSVS